MLISGYLLSFAALESWEEYPSAFDIIREGNSKDCTVDTVTMDSKFYVLSDGHPIRILMMKTSQHLNPLHHPATYSKTTVIVANSC